MIRRRLWIMLLAFILLAFMLLAIPAVASGETPYDITSIDGSAVALISNSWLSFEIVDQAEAGTTLHLEIAEDAAPAPGHYFTGEFTVDGVSLGAEVLEEGISYITSFSMPEKPVNVCAVQAEQKSITLNFTENASGELTADAMGQLDEMSTFADTGIFLWNEGNDEFIDLDISGVPDLAVADSESGTSYTLTLLPEADACGRYSFTFDGPTQRWAAVTMIFPDLGEPDFTLPASVSAIEESTFAGAAMTTVYIPDGCTSIGAYAFANCASLTKIRIPSGCVVDEHAFDGCGRVLVFAAMGSTAQTFCASSRNCAFVNDTGVYEHGNLAVRPVYTIRFLNDDGSVLDSCPIKRNEMPCFSGNTPEKATDQKYTYTFAGWTPEITEATGDADYTACYTPTLRKYTIRFLNVDGTVLDSCQVAWGETPSYKQDTPERVADQKYTYTFAGWTPEITEVTGDANYTACYTPTLRKYTIRFLDVDGTVLKENEVSYGDTPIVPDNPAAIRSGNGVTYDFHGWAPDVTAVSGGADYMAVYGTDTTLNVTLYTITFYDDDGVTVIGTTKLYAKDTPAAQIVTPTVPTKSGCTFVGWIPELADVTRKAAYTAIYQSNSSPGDDPNVDPGESYEDRGSVEVRTLNTDDDEYDDIAGKIDAFDVDAIDDVTEAAIFNCIDPDCNSYEMIYIEGWKITNAVIADTNTVTFGCPSDYNIQIDTRLAVLICIYGAEDEVSTWISSGNFCEQGIVKTNLSSETSNAIKNNKVFIAAFFVGSD